MDTQEVTSGDLRPCPFCGGAGYRMEGILDDHGRNITETDGCASCGIWLTPKEWNTRPSDSGNAEGFRDELKREIDQLAQMAEEGAPFSQGVGYMRQFYVSAFAAKTGGKDEDRN